MVESHFDHSHWYDATYLTERMDSLNSLGAAPEKSKEGDLRLAKERLQRWKSQAPFDDEALYIRRLKYDGLTEEDFRYLLGEPTAALQDRLPTRPTWLDTLAQIFANYTATLADERNRASETTSPGSKFLFAIEPFRLWARKCMLAKLESLNKDGDHALYDQEYKLDSLLNSPVLAQTLLGKVSRTIILELNAARIRESLKGETPEARYDDFFTRLSDPTELLAILQRYPVLARKLTVITEHWVRFHSAFLDHLYQDWEALQHTFSPKQALGSLENIIEGVGDTHHKGKSVIIAVFSSGLRIVYKPKSLVIDTHFQTLLGWLNEKGVCPPFRTVKLLARSDYGWTEFVPYQSCTSVEEVNRFYQRQGGYLALLYALEATDFHAENLIACGEDPVLIDLESLFHPRLDEENAPENSVAKLMTYYSVRRVGLLPFRVPQGDQSIGLDLSGLGALAGQIVTDAIRVFTDAGTDQMHVARQSVETTDLPNRPQLNHIAVDPLNYADAVLAGFTATYQLLLNHREELLAEGGPLSLFAEDEIRVILRPTAVYGKLLNEGYHPSLLQNSLDYERFIDKLWVAIPYRKQLEKIVQYERDELLVDDIPMFTTRPNSRAMWTGNDKRLDDFLQQTSLQRTQERIRHLSLEDLERQRWFIEASLATLTMGDSSLTQHPSYRDHLRIGQDAIGTLPTDRRQKLLTAASAIGARLETISLKEIDTEEVTWFNLTMVNDQHWDLRFMDIALYDGLSGMALFYGYLGELTNEAHYVKLAQTILSTIRQMVELLEPSLLTLGAFSGWGGIIYTLSQLGALWDQPELQNEALALSLRLADLIPQDSFFDIMSGVAGYLVTLIDLHEVLPNQNLMAQAIRCGDHLLANMQRLEHGVAWKIRPDAPPLTGFLHGAAGIAWALLKLADVSKQARFQEVAMQAIAFERHLFSHEESNWPDLRGNQPNRFMTAWCHGATGIGLARLDATQYLDDPQLNEEINAALQTVITKGFGKNHSLCHGDLGNLDFLLQVSQKSGEINIGEQIQNLTDAILTKIKTNGVQCGVPLGVETPGLMTGLAGVGYELLRLAAPSKIPSILTLAGFSLSEKTR